MSVPSTCSTWAARQPRARYGPRKGRRRASRRVTVRGMSLPDEARELLALPPARFVGERDALARALEARGDGAAAEVKKLRRPLGLAWVLNRLARDRPEDVEALLRAGDRLRAGHRRALGGEGASELRAAEDEVRERARALRSEASRVLREAERPGDPAVLSRLELLLRVVAPLPGPEREAFRQGALTAEPVLASADLSGLALVPAAAAAPPPGRGRHPRAAAPAQASPAAARRDAREAKREAARQAREARRTRAEAERARKAARRDLARAAAEAKRAEADSRRADEIAQRAAERARELRARAETARAEVARREKEAGADPR
jgi:hypothetical protein